MWLQRIAEMEAQHCCGWIEIGFVVHGGAQGDADRGWARHQNFADLWDGEYADCRSSFVFHVHGHECLKRFEMTEMTPWLLRTISRQYSAVGVVCGALISRKSG